MDPVQTSISGLLLAALTVVAGVVKMLYKKVENLELAEKECQRRLSLKESQIASLRAEMVSFGALLDQKRADGVANVSGAEATFVVNARTRRIRDWNAGATIMFGYSPKEALREPADKLMPDNSTDEAKKAWESIYALDHPPLRGPFKTRIVTKSGMLCPVEMILAGWQDDQETLVAVTVRRRESDSDRSEEDTKVGMS